MKKLGILGGLGPYASAHFYELLTKMQKIKREQDHIEIFIHSVPETPDRTAFILNEGAEDPRPTMIRAMRTLVAAGANIIAIPCVTAHMILTETAEAVKVPVLNIIDETVQALVLQNVRTVGLLATDGTLSSGLFKKVLADKNIGMIVPELRDQRKLMHNIYEKIKMNNQIDRDVFFRLAVDLRIRGADTVILGCTELSLLNRDKKLGEGFTDMLEILARASLLYCGAKVRDKYSVAY